jgi:hypothetical protein
MPLSFPRFRDPRDARRIGTDLAAYTGMAWNLIARALLLVIPLVSISCDVMEECRSDSDCASGERCASGWFGGRVCRKPCSGDSDCGRGQYCANLYGDGTCVDGCRNSDDCGETSWCSARSCRAGCSSDFECRRDRPQGNSVCVRPEPETTGECRTQCQTDADCQGALAHQCTCGACIEPCVNGACPAGTTCRLVSACGTPLCFSHGGA